MVLPKVTFVLLCSYSIPFSLSAKVMICGTRIMASVCQQGRFFASEGSATKAFKISGPQDSGNLKLRNFPEIIWKYPVIKFAQDFSWDFRPCCGHEAMTNSSGTSTLKSINEARALTIEHSEYFLLWLD